MTGALAFDVAHLLAGAMVVVSFLLLRQGRVPAMVTAFAVQAVLLSASVAWQGAVQGAGHLYVTALLTLGLKAVVIPLALARMARALGTGDAVEAGLRPGLTMLGGIALVALSLVVMLRATGGADRLAREDLAFALSIVLLGLLVMVTRRNVLAQVVGFMSLENGLILAAAGARGMPLVVEISVAFSVLIALIVTGLVLFRIRERFGGIEDAALDEVRGERS